MPLRSPGCFACRKRKIRCDEGRPGCQRCATHGIPCPGYRGDKNGPSGGIEFKDQTDITVERAKGTFKRGGRGGGRDGRVAGVMSAGKGANGAKLMELKSDDEWQDWMTASSGQGDWTMIETSPASTTTVQPLTPFSLDDLALDEDFTSTYHHLPTPHRSNPSTRATTPLPLSLASPALERASLYQSFITQYLPRKTLTGIQEGHFHFFQTLALQRSSNPALQHGFDALSLVQLGSTHHDAGLLNQATKQYALALRSLGRSITRGDFLHDDEVLAAVNVLSSCELYEGIQVQGQGWAEHVKGANQLVAARGPESLQSELALLLFAHMRHGVLIHALIERKAPFMARKEWRDVAWRVPLKRYQSNFFYEWGLQVPGLLERHDGLGLKSEGALEELDALLADSAEIERELRQWYAAWEVMADMAFGGLFELVPITKFSTFLGLCDDDAFTTALMFPDFLIGYLLTMYWMTMHALRTNTQSLHRKRHHLLDDWYPEPEDEVQESELLGYVLSLCQSIPYNCEPESSSSGSIGIFLPMRTAAMYFTAHGHWRLLKWVGCVRNNVFVKGLRPPSVDGKMSPGGKSPPKSPSPYSSPGSSAA